MRLPLSVTIVAKNEEKNIERCLRSLQWADEIVVVDSGSTDRTKEICREFGCRVIESKWLGYGKTKRFAVEQASYDWILSIDADEEVTPELKEKIEKILIEPEADGYRIKRKSFYLEKLIKHSGWDRDYPLRLFNKKKGNFNEKSVHESVKIEGSTSKIDEPILHYTYPSLFSHVQKMNEYTQLAAEMAASENRTSSLIAAITRGAIKFIKMYVLQKGFLDGKVGFLLALHSAYGVFLKYCKIWEKTR